MNKLRTASILVGGAIMASHTAFAGIAANDLYFGFQNQAGGGTADYIVNIGSASSLLGAGTVTDLSSDFSLSDFQSVLGSSSGMYVGLVGGVNGSTADIYTTQLRGGGAGSDFLVPGTESAPNALTRGQDDSTYSAISSLDGPATGTGLLDSSKSWENNVEPTYSTGSFYGQSGINPDSLIDTTGPLYEDLWETTSSSLSGAQSFTYLGYFTIDDTGSSLDVTFTATPEPGTYALAGLGSLLLFTLRRRFTGKNA